MYKMALKRKEVLIESRKQGTKLNHDGTSVNPGFVKHEFYKCLNSQICSIEQQS